MGYIGVVLLIPSLIWLSRKIWHLMEGFSSRGWPAVEGEIVEAKIWQYRFAKYGYRVSAPQIRYRYQVEGKVYEGGPVVFGSTAFPAEALAPYPPGKAIEVYYAPQQPERARLRRGNRVGDYLELLLPLLVVTASALMIWTQFRLGW